MSGAGLHAGCLGLRPSSFPPTPTGRSSQKQRKRKKPYLYHLYLKYVTASLFVDLFIYLTQNVRHRQYATSGSVDGLGLFVVNLWSFKLEDVERRLIPDLSIVTEKYTGRSTSTQVLWG